ncbi:ketoacyl-synthetase C-terminal extension domain-containing protein [Micromonospora sp. M12]
MPLAELNLRVVTERLGWQRPFLAGVSSFGIGGTNCHLVVGPAPSTREPVDSAPPMSAAPWLLSARTRKPCATRPAPCCPGWTGHRRRRSPTWATASP